MYEILDNIQSPADIKSLSLAQLEKLCAEIRGFIVESCAENPGHLGSSLGSVDLIVALHYVFDTPSDKIVFDVGHQAYAHKILTLRKDEFKTLRREGGLSGFPKRSESLYDAFGTGHSSTSVSAALGLAEAARIEGRKERVVAIIGDGALTGGLAFEGLNNAGSSKADLLVILNDNNVSIDSNTGAVHNYLLKITTDPTYNKVKRKIWDRLGEGRLRDRIQKMVHDTKSNLVRGSGGALFEALGFRYFGPVDGHDIAQLVRTLQRLRDLKGPRLLHCITKKGKGYAPAEQDPTVWHAPGRFDPKTGERLGRNYPADRYQDVFSGTLCDLAKDDPRVAGVTPAMASGCGMSAFGEMFPERFFDVGIEEEHAVTFSAGLAAGGLRPFCNIYSSFAQRSYDQVIHDVALQGLPVILCLDRAGAVGEDGATHQGLFDMAAFRCIPGCTISAPRNERELRNLMFTALQQESGPFIIRYPRGCGEGVKWKDTPMTLLPPGKGEKLAEGSCTAILCLGPVCSKALEAASEALSKGIPAPAVYDMRYLKPIDEDILKEVFAHYDRVVTAEDGVLKGGLFSEVAEQAARRGYKGKVTGVGAPDEFVSHASRLQQLSAFQMDKDGILQILVNE